MVLKRALYFITCNGRMMYNTRLEESYITRNLLDEENCRKHGNEAAFQQLSLFGDEMGSRRLYTENTRIMWTERWELYESREKNPGM